MAQNLGQEFKITKCNITAERLGEEFDLKQMIGEISFYEDLEKSYVTAELVILDDNATFSDDLKIKGTETIEITVEGVEEEFAGAQFTYKMNLVSIVQVQKGGERSEIYHLTAISPHAYRDQGIKISRSYTGKLEDIAEAVLKNHLETKVDRNYTGGTPSKQDPVRIITPYISPLETVDWLLERATTEIGAPYYAYCTLYDQTEGEDRVRFGTLEHMFSKTPFNVALPLLYSQSRGQQSGGKDLASQAKIIKDLRVENIQDQFKLMQEGAVGAKMSSYDVFTSQNYERHFAVSELLEKMEGYGLTKGGEQNVFDDQQMLKYEGEEKVADQWDHRVYSTITSYGTYGSVNSYHDVFDQSQALNKLRSSSMKSLFNKNMIDIQVPGIIFFAPLAKGTSGVTVGDIVDIEFMTTQVEEDEPKPLINKELSGTYLIHKVRNLFTSTRHEVIASISKIADIDA